MNLPNLLIPGAAKSATSSLHEYLNQHPDIFMSPRKEPHFFSDDDRFAGGVEWYSGLFRDGENCRFRGESSTGYMVFPKVIERMKRLLTDPKFIFVLRNPVERAHSHYWWLRGIGFENRPFREALVADKDLDPEPGVRVPFGAYRFYFQFGLYAKWLRRFLAAFPQRDIHVITTERLRREPIATLGTCFAFLGLDPLAAVDVRRHNETVAFERARLYRLLRLQLPKALRRLIPQLVSDGFLDRAWRAGPREIWTTLAEKVASRMKRYPAMDSEDRRWLADMYADDVRLLRGLVGLPFDEWSSEFPDSSARIG